MVEIASCGVFKNVIDLAGSQKELAKVLGVDPSFISQVATGRRVLPIEHCRAIKARYGVALSQLRPDIFAEAVEVQP